MIKKAFAAFMCMAVFFTISSCAKTAEPDTGGSTAGYTEYQLRKPQKGDTVAVFTTAEGTFKVRLFPEEAPRTVENFVEHARDGYYDGLTFHRVLKDFMIQGGDPLGTGYGGESIWGTPFRDEFSPRLYNFRGALSMANSGKSNTNGSQFFIVQKGSLSENEIEYLEYYHYLDEVIAKYKELGGTMWLDNAHTVFGQVYEGMEVVDKIASLPVKDPDSGEPVNTIIIEKVEIQTME
jgi:peptidyl-prolyl cis-trans isomerase B (cyclophilin B)